MIKVKEDNKKTRVASIMIALVVALTMTFGAAVTADAATKMTAGKVTGVKATSISTTSVKVSWGKKKAATGYKIYRAASKTGKYKLVKTIKKGSVKSWKNTGLKSGKTYWYKVKAYQKYKKSGKAKVRYTKFSAKASAKTKKAMTSTAVKGVKASAVSTTSIKVSWNKKAKATGYKIYRATSKTGKYKLVKTIKKGGTAYWKNTGLKSGKTYWYKVKAYQKSGEKTRYTKFSVKVKAKTKASSGSSAKEPVKEEAVTSDKVLSAKSNGKTIEIRWNEIEKGEWEYELQRSPAGGTYSWKTIAHNAEPYTLERQPRLTKVPEDNLVRFGKPDDTAKFFYRDSDVSKDKKYAYRVRMLLGKDTGSWSKTVTVTVPQIDVPNQLCVSGITTGDHKGTHISWGKVSGATSYILEVKAGASGTWKKLDTSGAVQDPVTRSRLMLDLEAVPPAKVCWYRIKACVNGQYSGYAQCVIHGSGFSDGEKYYENETKWTVGDPSCSHDMELADWYHGGDRPWMCATCGYYFINGDGTLAGEHMLNEAGFNWTTTVYRCTKCGMPDELTTYDEYVRITGRH